MMRLWNFAKVSVLIGATCILAGCASVTPTQKSGAPLKQTTAPVLKQPVIETTPAPSLPVAGSAAQTPSPSAAQLLEQAATAAPPQKQSLQLQAAYRLIQNNQLERASQLLELIDTSTLPADLTAFKHILRAKIDVLTHQGDQALAALGEVIQPNTLEPSTQILYYTIKAEALAAQGQLFDSVAERVQLSSLLINDPSLRQHNMQAIWTTLQQMSLPSLTVLQDESNSTTLKGWLTLAYISKQYAGSPEQLAREIDHWKLQYPDHPANALLAQTISGSALPLQPKKIAVLLPETGPLGPAGRAIRDGLSAEFYQEKSKNNSAPTLQFYNTATTTPITAIYQKAVSDGANLVIGPVNKPEIEMLIAANAITVPTLALNYTNNGKLPDNLYEFGISPQAEAIEVANKAWQAGHRNAIVLSPRGGWGVGVAQAFSHRWQALGGRVVGTLYYGGDPLSLARDIKQLLQVRQYKVRTKQANGASFMKEIGKRREDFDVFFLAGLPEMARQIRPLLKFYYAGHVPVYAISSIYSGTPNPRLDRDLDGVIFCDMPAVLKPTAHIIPETQTNLAWPNTLPPYVRLYALGLDAYRISTQLRWLLLFPKLGLNGATGQLMLDQKHQVQQTLLFAQMQHGVPVLQK